MKKPNWLKKLNKLDYILIGVAVLILVLFVGKKIGNKEASVEKEETKIEEVVKKTDLIKFNEWTPNGSRRILGTVESSSDILIYSYLSGDISQVFVEIGDNVSKGEIIAKFSRENDLSQISYENALNSLENTRVAAESSIKSAEINLENAKNDLEQAIVSNDKNYSQIFTILASQANNADTSVSNALNWADRIIGTTNRRRYEVDNQRAEVGKNNSILKNETKNLLENSFRDFNESQELTYSENNSQSVISFASAKNEMLKKTQLIIRNIDTLIRQTSVNASFTNAYRSQLQQEAEANSAKIDGTIISLESQIEAAKSGKEGLNSAILGAENRVKNAESNLEIARSNSSTQISSFENQKRIAAKSINDLNVRAPFSGKISAKFVNNFDRVGPGQQLFSIISNDSVPEISAYLTIEESKLLDDLEKVKIQLSDGEIIDVEEISASGRIDNSSQKMEVKFRGNSDKLLVGSITNVLLPIDSNASNLVPISAISFEPDGAEVFVVNSAKLVERRKVQTGKIFSNAIEILNGLEESETIVQYRNRVNTGDKVEIKN